MRSLTEHLMPDGKSDKERAIKEGLDRRAEAQKKDTNIIGAFLGCKIEFDPASNYEKIIEDFAKEALANLEPAYLHV